MTLMPRWRSSSDFKNLEPDLHFFDRIGSERHAQGVADALREQVSKTHGRFDGPGHRRSCLGNADMQGIVRLMRKQPIGIDRMMHVRRLERHLHVRESHVFQRMDGIERRFGQGFRGRPAVFIQQRPLQ